MSFGGLYRHYPDHHYLVLIIDCFCIYSHVWNVSLLTYNPHGKETLSVFPFKRGSYHALFMSMLVYTSCWPNSLFIVDLRRHIAYITSLQCVPSAHKPLAPFIGLPLGVSLPHLKLDKMAALMTDDNFKCILLNYKIHFPFEFRWHLLPGARLTISQHWFR